MEFYLSSNDFAFLKKYVPLAVDRIKKSYKEGNEVRFFLDDDDVIDFQLDINDEIVDVGMDNQDTVNDIGIELYKIYDELLYQKRNK